MLTKHGLGQMLLQWLAYSGLDGFLEPRLLGQCLGVRRQTRVRLDGVYVMHHESIG